jgi:hypothetical protein
MYDIVFISYNEPNADENYEALKKRFPSAKRVDGVKGIHRAHIEAAKKCFTKMFWVVDADAQIVDDFNFDYVVPNYDLTAVHVWQSINPINDLVYGYGGVKLLPRRLTLKMDLTKTDMTTSISDNFKAIEQIANVTAFNTDEFNTWKSAFRECVKLSSKTIQGQKDEETEERLDTWCLSGEDRQFGSISIRAARSGRNYGTRFRDDEMALSKINDFEWLKEFYLQEGT